MSENQRCNMESNLFKFKNKICLSSSRNLLRLKENVFFAEKIHFKKLKRQILCTWGQDELYTLKKSLPNFVIIPIVSNRWVEVKQNSSYQKVLLRIVIGLPTRNRIFRFVLDRRSLFYLCIKCWKQNPNISSSFLYCSDSSDISLNILFFRSFILCFKISNRRGYWIVTFNFFNKHRWISRYNNEITIFFWKENISYVQWNIKWIDRQWTF